MTLPLIGSNLIFQEVDYIENSTISSSLQGQTFYAFRQLHKLQVCKMKGIMVIHFVRKVALYVSTAAVNRNKRKGLSVEEKVKLIQQTENGKKKAAMSGVWSH